MQSRVSKIPLLAASKCQDTDKLLAKEAKKLGKSKYKGKKWELFMIAKIMAAEKNAKALF